MFVPKRRSHVKLPNHKRLLRCNNIKYETQSKLELNSIFILPAKNIYDIAASRQKPMLASLIMLDENKVHARIDCRV
jgi:hypothetical protein